MPIAIGQQLGSYEITALLGKGGMGEVYRAGDLKLKREVAIKILPEEFSLDGERANRFQREAEVLASLNHPNVAAIYDVEEADNIRFLVLELVEGETLGERIQRGAVPVEEALDIARHICEAVEAAHEKGVIHRDLKPANVKITPEGKVKVLDFGLAKALEGAPGRMTSNSPTLLSAASIPGVILGTAGYMSPEQARGHDADQRSDIFSFGCVLFEMLTGRQTFQGETVTDIIASIVKSDPDFHTLPRNLNPKIQDLLRRCLAKNRKDRWHAIADARVELETLMADPHGAKLQAGTGIQRRTFWRMVAAFAMTLVLAIAITAFVVWRARPQPQQPVIARFSFALPAGQSFSATQNNVAVISPDGTNIVYVANEQLYLRTIGQMEARPVQGTAENPGTPFFSPDGRWIAYVAINDRKLKKTAITGGAAVTICDMDLPFGGTWDVDDQIYVGQARGIVRVSAQGGKPEIVAPVKPGELIHGPQILLGGKALLFTLRSGSGWDNAQIVVQDLNTGARKALLTGTDARYVSTGHLVYALGPTVFAVPLDAQKLQVTGGPVPVIEAVKRSANGSTAAAYFSVSSNGSMIYVPGRSGFRDETMLVQVDRSGLQRPLNVPLGQYATPRISPDGKQLAMVTDDNKDAIVWTYDLAGNAPPRRLTFGGQNRNPLWTPDGQRIVFSSARDDDTGIFWQPADGSGSAERLVNTEPKSRFQPESWSPDAKTLIYILNPGGVAGSIEMISVGVNQSAKRLADFAGGPNLSRDGKWLAYQARESGRIEVYVQPFPLSGAKYQITTNGGSNPLWSHDGKQLFYLRDRPGRGRQIVVVDVQTQPRFTFGKETPLPIEGLPPSGARSYDISPDDKYFIVALPKAAADPAKNPPEQINITLNWFRELQERVPVK